ncbi:MAG: hypothetical protein KAR06_02200 [Deltaproteobacteria bacterium]|nr:hypothetical protein [Deltaproteobacteria bacterium]
MRYILVVASLLCVVTVLSGCTTAQQHRRAVQDDSGDRMTVGTVQREIKVGMAASEVAEVLGSPNIVTTDEERRETWIYDKISTDRVYSSSSGGILALIFVGTTPIGGGIGGGVNESAGATSTSQRTLTVIIKFDKESKVRDFSYHTSRF